MTIAVSDDFTGVTASASFHGRSMNHALGGSGSITWANNGSGAYGATGGNAVNAGNSNANVQWGNSNGKIRIKFRYATASGNIAIWGRAGQGGASGFIVLLVGTSSLRVRELDSGGASLGDKATVSISAISSGTDYYIEAEYDGTTVKGRIFESDGTTQRGSTVSYTPGTYPSGTYWGLSEYFSGNNHIFDDVTIDDLGGAAPEIAVSGNSTNITNGDATPSTSDHTDFGTTTQGGGTISRTFTVQNTGSAALSTSSLSVPSGFTVTEGLSASISAGGSDTFTVRLDDSVVGTKSGNVTFTNDDSDENPFTFAITGTVATPPAEVSVTGNGVDIVNGDATPSGTDHTDFGGVNQGDPGIERTFTVHNTGGTDLNVSGLSVPTGFTIVDGLPLAIVSGGSDDFIVRLDSSVVGTKSGNISFTNDDSDENPFTFAITGVVNSPPPPPPPPPSPGDLYRAIDGLALNRGLVKTGNDWTF